MNCAGVRGVGSIVDTERRIWDLNMSVNLSGTFNTCQAFCRYAKETGRKGAIVNISSQAGVEAVPNRLSDSETLGPGRASLPGVSHARILPARSRCAGLPPARRTG